MPEHSSFQLSSIGQISVHVHDIQKSLQFYRDILGMKFLFEVPGMAFFDCNGVRLMLSLSKAEFYPPGSIIYYRVDDIEAAYQELCRRKVEFVSKPHRITRMPEHDLWMAFFKDIDENTLALMSEIPVK